MNVPSINAEASAEVSNANTTGSIFDAIIPEAQRAQAANYWAKLAMMEHASVASFSRFSLELMSIGAPTDLLALVHQAALDEVRHTQISLDMANHFSATTFAPGALPLSDKADFSFGNAEKIAAAAALEGCIEETIAASIALYQAENMADSYHRNLLRSVALDEASHAALAWRAVQWITNSSPETRKVVSEVFSARAERYASVPQGASEPTLQHLGLLDKGTMEKLQYNAWHEIVVPAAVSLGFLPKTQASSGNGGQIADVIAHALTSCNQPVA
jgi:hypothetical protein